MTPQSPMPATRRVRVALVGCGRISKNHLDAIDKVPEFIEGV